MLFKSGVVLILDFAANNNITIYIAQMFTQIMKMFGKGNIKYCIDFLYNV